MYCVKPAIRPCGGPRLTGRDSWSLFRPRKNFVRIEPRLEKSTELETRLEAAGLDMMDYDSRWGRYRINLQAGDLDKHKELITEITEAAYKVMTGD